MRVGHLLCGGGADAGQILGALVDAGASVEAIEAAVGALGGGDVRLAVGRVDRGGLESVTVRVRAPQATAAADRLADVHAILDGACLDPGVDRPARAAFAALVSAMAAAEDRDAEALALHPVAALDDLAGIVAVCCAVADLGLEDLTCGPVTVATGLVGSALGTRPAPGGVTAALLAGFERRELPLADELVTPVGAALLATLARPAIPAPTRLEVRGAGAGHPALGAAGVLWILVGRRPADGPWTTPRPGTAGDPAGRGGGGVGSCHP